jgi:hypothetical protein
MKVRERLSSVGYSALEPVTSSTCSGVSVPPFASVPPAVSRPPAYGENSA